MANSNSLSVIGPDRGGHHREQRLGDQRRACDHLRALDISVVPTGAGLPSGQGTARADRALYVSMCAACHGARGEGVGDFSPRAGGRGTLASARPLPTVGSYWPYATTLWDYIRRDMPYLAPGSLAIDDV